MFGWLRELWAAGTRRKAKPIINGPRDDGPDPIEELVRIVGVTPAEEPPLTRQRPPSSIARPARRRSQR